MLDINVKLEDPLRGAIRLKQYSLRTEEAYVGWDRRFVLWHGKRHPREMGAPEVEAFLTHLTVNRGLGAVSQNQALNVLMFLYREVLKLELAGIEAKRAKQTRRLPLVLTTAEAGELLEGGGGRRGAGVQAPLWLWAADVGGDPVAVEGCGSGGREVGGARGQGR